MQGVCLLVSLLAGWLCHLKWLTMGRVVLGCIEKATRRLSNGSSITLKRVEIVSEPEKPVSLNCLSVHFS